MYRTPRFSKPTSGDRGKVLLVVYASTSQMTRLFQYWKKVAPKYVSSDEIPEDERAAERRVFEEKAKEEGKPDNVVEKIVEPDEQLPADWPVAGTTGYDFMNRLNGLFVATHHSAAMDSVYADFTGRRLEVQELATRFNEQGLRPADSLHLASAIHGQADYFCTSDDKLLRRARRMDTSRTRVVSPLELIEEIESWRSIGKESSGSSSGLARYIFAPSPVTFPEAFTYCPS